MEWSFLVLARSADNDDLDTGATVLDRLVQDGDGPQNGKELQGVCPHCCILLNTCTHLVCAACPVFLMIVPGALHTLDPAFNLPKASPVKRDCCAEAFEPEGVSLGLLQSKIFAQQPTAAESLFGLADFPNMAAILVEIAVGSCRTCRVADQHHSDVA